MIDKVIGKCPMGCGNTLFLGAGGHVTCSYSKCPQPDSASRLLENADRVKKVFDAFVDADLRYSEVDRIPTIYAS